MGRMEIQRIIFAPLAMLIVLLVLAERIQTVSLAQILHLFSLRKDALPLARTGIPKIPQIRLAVSAKISLLQGVNLAIQHVRLALHLRYRQIRQPAHCAFLHVFIQVESAYAEILKTRELHSMNVAI